MLQFLTIILARRTRKLVILGRVILSAKTGKQFNLNFNKFFDRWIGKDFLLHHKHQQFGEQFMQKIMCFVFVEISFFHECRSV